jgi:hypothetical protein
MDDYMADDIDVIAELDDGENYETIFVSNIHRFNFVGSYTYRVGNFLGGNG